MIDTPSTLNSSADSSSPIEQGALSAAEGMIRKRKTAPQPVAERTVAKREGTSSFTDYKQSVASAFFPKMSDEQLQALVEDIKMNGQREPILVKRGEVVDGWHRYLACRQLERTPQVCEVDAGCDETAMAVSLNLQRRHLSTSQKAIIAAKLTLRSAPSIRDDSHHSITAESRITVPTAEKLFAVSERLIRAARRIVESGDAEVEQRVVSGDLAISSASDIIREADSQQRAEKLKRALNLDDEYEARKGVTRTIRCIANGGAAKVSDLNPEDVAIVEKALERTRERYQSAAVALDRALQQLSPLSLEQLEDVHQSVARLTKQLHTTLKKLANRNHGATNSGPTLSQ